ncbi:MAG: ABC transporter substrate-binding protein [Burkholderiales bacterium]
MNNRRKLIIGFGAGALVAPLRSFAQQPASRMHRIGFLGVNSVLALGKNLDAFLAGMRELGYIEGKNLVVEFRWAENKTERLAEFAAELVRLNVELIVTHSTSGALAAKQATSVIPIVVAAQGDAIASGLVTNLARPGGNLTGLNFFGAQMNAKNLELLKELLPQARRFGFLTNPASTSAAQESLRLLAATAKALKVEIQQFDVRGPQDFDRVFAEMTKRGVAALAVQVDPMLNTNVAAVASTAARRRIPAIGGIFYPEAGGLMGYGSDNSELFRRAASYVDKILKGARPGDLPIELPTRFEMVINMKAAKALGLKIPQSILLQATRLIE